MATGYDEEGIEELVCVDPPIGDDFTPTALYGGIYEGDEFPTYAFGVNDFSYEFWVKWCQGNDSPGADTTSLAAVWAIPAYTPRAGLWVLPTAYGIAAIYAGVSAGYQTIPLGWSHLAANYDRSGTLDYYVNGTQEGTQPAINANDMGTISFCPSFAAVNDARNVVMNGNNDGPTWYGGSVIRIWTGLVAMHNRLLTAAEILESYTQRRVQNISGVTQIRWDPRDLEGHTGWETRSEYLASSLRGGLSLPWGAPLGTYGEVLIPDSSGNGNDLLLPVATAYQNEQTAGLGVGSRARVCLVADPWWV